MFARGSFKKKKNHTFSVLNASSFLYRSLTIFYLWNITNSVKLKLKTCLRSAMIDRFITGKIFLTTTQLWISSLKRHICTGSDLPAVLLLVGHQCINIASTSSGIPPKPGSARLPPPLCSWPVGSSSNIHFSCKRRQQQAVSIIKTCETASLH